MKCPLELPAPHPALEGHFPGEPILPGVVLLDEALHAIERACGAAGPWRVGSVKFLGPVAERAALVLEYEHTASGSVRFTVRDGERPVATGTLARPAGG